MQSENVPKVILHAYLKEHFYSYDRKMDIDNVIGIHKSKVRYLVYIFTEIHVPKPYALFYFIVETESQS